MWVEQRDKEVQVVSVVLALFKCLQKLLDFCLSQGFGTGALFPPDFDFTKQVSPEDLQDSKISLDSGSFVAPGSDPANKPFGFL